MTGSDEVEPQQPRPNVMHASIAHSVTGLAGRLVVAYTHSGAEGVLQELQADLENAVKGVLTKHGWTE